MVHVLFGTAERRFVCVFTSPFTASYVLCTESLATSQLWSQRCLDYFPLPSNCVDDTLHKNIRMGKVSDSRVGCAAPKSKEMHFDREDKTRALES